MKPGAQLVLTGLFILGCLSAVYGQSRFSVSVSLTSNYSHNASKQILSFGDPNTQSTSTEVIANSWGLGYSVGLMGRYAFSPKWSVSTGIWASHGLSGTSNLSINGTNLSVDYEYRHPFEFAYTIPVLFNYQSSTKRLSPYFSAGALLNFRPTSYAIINGTEIPVKFGKSLTIIPLLGAGVIYRLTEHLSIIAQPTIQFDVQSHPTYSYYHAYSLSLQTQLMYHF